MILRSTGCPFWTAAFWLERHRPGPGPAPWARAGTLAPPRFCSPCTGSHLRTSQAYTYCTFCLQSPHTLGCSLNTVARKKSSNLLCFEAKIKQIIHAFFFVKENDQWTLNVQFRQKVISYQDRQLRMKIILGVKSSMSEQHRQGSMTFKGSFQPTLLCGKRGLLAGPEFCHIQRMLLSSYLHNNWSLFPAQL